jgi:hypothetical protein
MVNARPRWCSTTPLGRPVVPEVYVTQNGSSSSIAISGSTARPPERNVS